jgi:amidophosphoribosyltransferase
MCGIFGMYSFNIITLEDVLLNLKQIQHRGRDSHGVAYVKSNSSTIQLYKKKGLVDENINQDLNTNFNYAIGHVRYGTSSTKNYSLKEAQPLVELESKIALVHNGNIPNIKIHDSRYLLDLIMTQLKMNGENIVLSLIYLMNYIPAAFSLMVMYGNKIYVVRDKFGIRPLYYCVTDKYCMVCSETMSFPKDLTYGEVNPGEILEVSETGIVPIYQHSESQNSLCAFELLYFMSPENMYGETNVYSLRKCLGNQLAKDDKMVVQMNTIVVGVPTSGIAYGKGFANELYLPYVQVITKNNTSHFGADRTFILKNNDERNKACREKFKYDEDSIRGKNIIVVDDTIVRGNVIKNIILRLKSCGAREIHVRIPSPPVIDICQLGIDIKTREELLMYNYSISEATEYLEVDSLRFLVLDDLELLGFPQKCYAHCFGKQMPDEINKFIDDKIEIDSITMGSSN